MGAPRAGAPRAQPSSPRASSPSGYGQPFAGGAATALAPQVPLVGEPDDEEDNTVVMMAPSSEEQARMRPAAGRSAPTAPTTDDEPEWYVGIDGDPVGPIHVAFIEQQVKAGKVNGESLVWREDLTDWKPLSTFPVLAKLLKPVGVPAAQISDPIALTRANDDAKRAAEEKARADEIAAATAREAAARQREAERAQEIASAKALARASQAPSNPFASTVAIGDDPGDDRKSGAAFGFAGSSAAGGSGSGASASGASAALAASSSSSAAAAPGATQPQGPAGLSASAASEAASRETAPPASVSGAGAAGSSLGAPSITAAPPSAAPPSAAPPSAAPPVAEPDAEELRAAGIPPGAERRRRGRGMHPMAYALIAMAMAFGGVAAWFLFSAKTPVPTAQNGTATVDGQGNPVAPRPGAATTGEAGDAKPDASGITVEGVDIENPSHPKYTGGGVKPTGEGDNGSTPSEAPKPKKPKCTDPDDPFCDRKVDGPSSDGPNSGGTSSGAPLSPSQVNATVSKFRGSLQRRCRQMVTKGNAKVSASIRVSPSGSVSSVSTSGGGNVPGLAGCVQSRIANWRFPQAGAPTTVNLSFQFLSG